MKPVRTLLDAASAVLLMLGGLACAPVAAQNAAAGTPLAIAVFDFELEDLSPAASLLNKATSSDASMVKVTAAARAELQQSGRYRLVDVDAVTAEAARTRLLRNCDGCEAQLAGRLGAAQSLLGIVRRVTQTDYYVLIQIRDTRTGKLLDEQDANFAGSEEGWPSGVRMLIRHQILATGH
jgi:hypothetical protein